jgi:hypothetical protein
MGRSPKYDWRGSVLPAAAEFVLSFTTGVSLRQDFYFLGSHTDPATGRAYIDNTLQDYSNLSRWTTKARDAGTFPDFVDNGRRIHRPIHFANPDEAHEWLTGLYRRDRTEFADATIYLGVEKVGLVAQIKDWFDPLGLPILPLSGWSSQTFREQVRRKILDDGRPAVFIYAGDFDPAGVLIGDSFAAKVGVFTEVVRIGLNIDQIVDLPRSPFPASKEHHSLIPGFMAKYGDQLEAMGLPRLVQFELDALPPDQLRALYQAEIDRYFDESAYQRSLVQEAADRQELDNRWG